MLVMSYENCSHVLLFFGTGIDCWYSADVSAAICWSLYTIVPLYGIVEGVGPVISFDRLLYDSGGIGAGVWVRSAQIWGCLKKFTVVYFLCVSLQHLLVFVPAFSGALTATPSVDLSDEMLIFDVVCCSRVSYTQERHMYHVLVNDGITFLCMSEEVRSPQ